MIVRDEAHIVAEALDSVAPFIDHWVVVDTGSTDGTQDLVRRHMSALGIPGRVHERPWVDFGHNRTEALALAAGAADYLWVLDADDLVVGTPDLSDLWADSYLLRFGPGVEYWRPQLFRDGLRWRYAGVVHEHIACDDRPVTQERLPGEHHVESRRLGARNLDSAKYERDRDLLLAEVERDPGDARSTFYLAQSCRDAGDLEGARRWYAQRAAMPGWDEETYLARLRLAEVLEGLGEPWPVVQDAYLQAWETRPSRAEALCAVARHHRLAGAHRQAHLFASAAAAIPMPDDQLFVDTSVHGWRALDELAISSYWVGDLAGSFAHCQALLDRRSLPDEERRRVHANADLCVPSLLATSDDHPADLVAALGRADDRTGRADITLTMTTCRRLPLFERTLSSFLRCCTDHHRIDRWICVDNGSSDTDLARMAERFPFLELVVVPQAEGGHATALNRILELVDSPWWLHLEDDWQLFAPRPLITEALDVLAVDPAIGQVAFNLEYAEGIDERDLPCGPLRWTDGGTRYRVHEPIELGTEAWEARLASLEPGQRTNEHWPHFTLRPSLLRREALRPLGTFDHEGFFERRYAERFRDAGLVTAFLDDIVSVHLGRADAGAHSAYSVVGDGRHPADPAQDGPLPPIEVLNLARRADRWQSFTAAAADVLGPERAAAVRRRDAVDGTQLVMTDELRRLFRGNDFGDRRGVIGCALTHLAAWADLADSADLRRILLEDDVRLAPGFATDVPRAIASADRTAPGWDVLFLGTIDWEDAAPDPHWTDGDPLVRPMRWERYLGGAFAYALSRTGAARLLALVEGHGIQNGIDWFVKRHGARLTVLEAALPLASSPLARSGGSVDSDIQHDPHPVPPA